MNAQEVTIGETAMEERTLAGAWHLIHESIKTIEGELENLKGQVEALKKLLDEVKLLPPTPPS